MIQTAAWYAALLLLGVITFPMTAGLFAPFKGRGWLFARVLGVLLAGSFLWLLNCLKVVPFTRPYAVAAAGLLLAVNVIIFVRSRRARADVKTPAADPARGPRSSHNPAARAESPSVRLILLEELLFLAIFILAIYLIGFRPEAHGTEKPMDYAFLTAMLRGTSMPFADPWYGGEPINYYYGGQYLTAYLIRLSGVTAGYGYNLMRATITALSFVLPFSLVREAAAHYLARAERAGITKWAAGPANAGNSQEDGSASGSAQSDRRTGRKTSRPLRRASHLAAAAGIFGGLAVAFCGNGHYLIYGLILVAKEKLMPGSVTPLPDYPDRPYFYWFPDSTRYIGYYPDAPDKTIHEFPAYSSVLGDLHAHYINLIFVLLILAVLYVWLIRLEDKKLVSDPDLGGLLKEALWDPALILAGFMTGIFRWTNYWDFPIYAVVAGAVVLFGLWRKYRLDPVRLFVNLLLKAALMAVFSFLAALPFTATFDMIASEVHAVTSRTPLYQLVILWGIPASAVLVLFFMIMRTFRKEDLYPEEETEEEIRRPKGFMRLLATIAPEDLFMLIIGVSALGLVLLPELVYVRDIYEGEHYRANTMFKLTYQAFIMLGLAMGYVVARARANRAVLYRIYGWLLAGLLLILSTYSVKAAEDWFAPLKAEHKAPDAALYLETYYPTDAGAVHWLNAHIDGQPVVLEAPGDSYSDYGRISVGTGLPTVLGWYVHEWLWRGSTAPLDERLTDIETVYTSDDEAAVRAVIEKYGISYIYIGELEREKYGFVNDALLQSIGEVAYSDGETTYIMRVG